MQTQTTHTADYRSPLGVIRIVADDQSIHSITFLDEETSVDESSSHASSPLGECVRQLDEYFAGERREFSLPLAPEGGEFDRRVWEHLQAIPYGQTRSYLELAEALGNAAAVRAVGTANGRNPIAIVVPCHRVIGSDGSLTGYAGGLWRKQWLLEHEGVLTQMRLELG